MNTKYIKVAVSDRLPKQEGKYFVWVDCPNAKMYDTEKEQMEFNMDKKKFYLPDNEFQSFYDVTHWLDEVSDNEEELLQWKESALKVMNNINLQKVGKLLGVPLGQNISTQILPSIEMLIKENEQLKKMVSK